MIILALHDYEYTQNHILVESSLLIVELFNQRTSKCFSNSGRCGGRTEDSVVHKRVGEEDTILVVKTGFFARIRRWLVFFLGIKAIRDIEISFYFYIGSMFVLNEKMLNNCSKLK